MESDEISEEVYLPLKESIGHTEVEVIAGALFGKRSKSIYSKSLCIWERRREMQVLARNLAQRVSRSQVCSKVHAFSMIIVFFVSSRLRIDLLNHKVSSFE